MNEETPEKESWQMGVAILVFILILIYLGFFYQGGCVPYAQNDARIARNEAQKQEVEKLRLEKEKQK